MKILVVDDEDLAVTMLCDAIKEARPDAEVYPFKKPYEMLSFAEENPCDIAFLDIEMRGMTGLQAAKALKDQNPKINIIFVTGHSEYMEQAFGLYVSGYVLKPVTKESVIREIKNLRHPEPPPTQRIRIQTFGNFEVFVNGRPLQMTRAKPKELLAYLVNKQGSSVTKAQIAAVLWEDREYDRPLQKRTSKIITQMLETLRDAGIEDIIFKNWNNFAVDVSKFDCDYYQFLKGNIREINNYAGEYMNEYSWAEMTAAMLALRK